MPKRYIATRNVEDDIFAVTVEDGDNRYPLNPRNDFRDHSPTGISWGYGGSGPAQCALAILLDFLGDGHRDTVERLYMEFKWAFIARFPMDAGWVLTGEDINAFLLKAASRDTSPTRK